MSAPNLAVGRLRVESAVRGAPIVDQTVLGAVEHAPYRFRSPNERVDVKSLKSVALRHSCRAKTRAQNCRLMKHCISLVASSSVRQCRQTHRCGGSEHPKLLHSTTRLGRDSCSAHTLRDHHPTGQVQQNPRTRTLGTIRTGTQCASEFSCIYVRALNLYSMHDSRGAIAKYG